MFFLEVHLEDGLGCEVLATLCADFSEAQVLGVDVDLQVVAGTELAATELAGEARALPGVFVTLLSRQVPLRLTEVVAGQGHLPLLPLLPLLPRALLDLPRSSFVQFSLNDFQIREVERLSLPDSSLKTFSLLLILVALSEVT